MEVTCRLQAPLDDFVLLSIVYNNLLPLPSRQRRQCIPTTRRRIFFTYAFCILSNLLSLG
jgi:hypothetical protein